MSARVEAAAKAWVARHSQPGSWTLEQNLDAALAAADQITFSEAAIERAAEVSWNAIIDGASPWSELDDETKRIHTETTRAVVAALREEA